MSPDPAVDVLDRLRQVHVKTVCVCPGARNAELVRLLSQPDCGFEVFWFPEERSASFFALGRCRQQGEKAAVVTTSGTAVGELLPAVMEAYYSGRPLILLTADRPRRFRGSGAPQAAEQVGIFGKYAERAYDLEGAELLPNPFDVGEKPVHINMCFEDPNSNVALERPPGSRLPYESVPWYSDDISTYEIEDGIAQFKRPIVIVGLLEPWDHKSARRFLASFRAPVYLESLSGLRGATELGPFEIRVADRLLARVSKAGYEPDGVIRLGGVPTHRFWRDLEDVDLPVFSVSRLEFSGLGRESTHVRADMADLPSEEEGDKLQPIEGAEGLLEEDRALHGCLESLLDQEPDSEPGLFRLLSRAIPSNSLVFVGNSLPVREWDLAACWLDRGLEVVASRGLNGIDGQISTFLGMCWPGRSNWAILGDLTTLYDLAGPWPLSQLPQDLNATLVIINNGGGKIFDRMFPETAFQNRHNLSFEHWAAMWGLGYERADTAEALAECARRPNAGLRVIEVRPDVDSTGRFWAAYNEALA